MSEISDITYTAERRELTMSAKPCLEDCWLGTVVVGERGQVVIPAEARKKLSINTGDTMFAISHPSGEGILLYKIDTMREFLAHLAAGLNLAEAANAESRVTDGSDATSSKKE
jgi:AbrB family looped-hinge helix DNA binding protein